jgi:hypothetical protein
MLTIFRRHLKACPQTSRRYRRRQCPIWIEGTLGLEDVPRRSLNLTSWDAAEEYVRESNRTGKVGGTSAKPMLIADTVELYLADVQSRVRTSTVRLHRVLLRDSLLVWCAEKGYRYLSELDVKALIEYRSSWQFAPLTALKKFERLRSFFRFCHAAKWMPENPTLAIRAPKADTPPTLPFTNEEVDRVPPLGCEDPGRYPQVPARPHRRAPVPPARVRGGPDGGRCTSRERGDAGCVPCG